MSLRDLRDSLLSFNWLMNAFEDGLVSLLFSVIIPDPLTVVCFDHNIWPWFQFEKYHELSLMHILLVFLPRHLLLFLSPLATTLLFWDVIKSGTPELSLRADPITPLLKMLSGLFIQSAFIKILYHHLIFTSLSVLTVYYISLLGLP